MVTASVDNTVIKEILNSGQSVTVPTGETWKIHVKGYLSSTAGQFDIDGKKVAGSNPENLGSFVVPEGTTLKHSDGDASTHLVITGFKL
jgi:hypothetical protein